VRWKNQILENAKQAAVALGFPEGAHNEIMGWRFLVESTPSAFLFLDGTGDGERTRRGIEAARAEVARAGGKSLLVAGHGKTPAERMLSDVLLGDRVSFELARLRGVDPVPVEAITRFKQA
jgi:glucose/mannose-6-phosphate isomerase